MQELPELRQNQDRPMSRRDIKRKIVSLQTMLRARDVTADNRNLIEKNILELRKQGSASNPQASKELIQKRRDFVEQNPGLKDVFQALWTVFFKYTNDGFLSKEGYIKFNRAILVSLGGVKAFEDMNAMLENDWAYDKVAFGPFDRQGFFDLLFETIETWTEVVNPAHYAAFAWTLLDSIADTSIHPPKLRPFREIKCITKLENEASMINNYLKNKQVRSALSIESEWLSRVPEVQKRLQSRKFGAEFNTHHQSMIEAIAQSGKQKSVNINTQEDDNNYSDSDESHKEDDNDEEEDDTGIVRISDLLQREVPEPDKIEGEEDLGSSNRSVEEKQEEAKSLASGDESDDFSLKSFQNGPTIFETTQIPFRSKKAYVPNRQTTVSFMSYVEARRASRAELNGYIQRSSTLSYVTLPEGYDPSRDGQGVSGISDRDHSDKDHWRQNLVEGMEASNGLLHQRRENVRAKFVNYMQHGNLITPLSQTTVNDQRSNCDREGEINGTSYSMENNREARETTEDSKFSHPKSSSYLERDSEGNSLIQYIPSQETERESLLETPIPKGVVGATSLSPPAIGFLQIDGKTLFAGSLFPDKAASRDMKAKSTNNIKQLYPTTLEELQPFLIKFDGNTNDKNSTHLNKQVKKPVTIPSIRSDSNVKPEHNQASSPAKSKAPTSKTQTHSKVLSQKLFENSDLRPAPSLDYLSLDGFSYHSQLDQQIPSLTSTSVYSSASPIAPVFTGPYFSIDAQTITSLSDDQRSVSSSVGAVKRATRSYFGEHLPVNQSHDPLQPQITQALVNYHQRVEEVQRQQLTGTRSQLLSASNEGLSFLDIFLQRQETRSPPLLPPKALTSLPHPKPRKKTLLVKPVAASASKERLPRASHNRRGLTSPAESSLRRESSSVFLNSQNPSEVLSMQVKPVDLLARNRLRPVKKGVAGDSLNNRNPLPNIVLDGTETTKSDQLSDDVPAELADPLTHPSQANAEPVPSSSNMDKHGEVAELPSKFSITDTLITDDSQKIPIDDSLEETQQRESKALEVHQQFQDSQKSLSLNPDFLLSLRRQQFEYSYQLSDAKSFQRKNFRNLQAPSKSPICSPTNRSATFLTIVGSDPSHVQEQSLLKSSTSFPQLPLTNSSSYSHAYNFNPDRIDLSPSGKSPKRPPWISTAIVHEPEERRSYLVSESISRRKNELISSIQLEAIQRDNVFNRSNIIDIWKDKLEMRKLGGYVDNAKHHTMIIQQRHHRHAFENYANTLSKELQIHH